MIDIIKCKWKVTTFPLNVCIAMGGCSMHICAMYGQPPKYASKVNGVLGDCSRFVLSSCDRDTLSLYSAVSLKHVTKTPNSTPNPVILYS